VHTSCAHRPFAFSPAAFRERRAISSKARRDRARRRRPYAASLKRSSKSGSIGREEKEDSFFYRRRESTFSGHVRAASERFGGEFGGREALRRRAHPAHVGRSLGHGSSEGESLATCERCSPSNAFLPLRVRSRGFAQRPRRVSIVSTTRTPFDRIADTLRSYYDGLDRGIESADNGSPRLLVSAGKPERTETIRFRRGSRRYSFVAFNDSGRSCLPISINCRGSRKKRELTRTKGEGTTYSAASRDGRRSSIDAAGARGITLDLVYRSSISRGEERQRRSPIDPTTIK